MRPRLRHRRRARPRSARRPVDVVRVRIQERGARSSEVRSLKEIVVDSLSRRIRDIIAVELQVDGEKVTPEARLRQDLGMDSVAALNILFAAEETFGIAAIDVAELAAVSTVRDVESLLRQHVSLHPAT
ncbi:MAG: hypothetical protein B6D46_14270 [Polyangiaceae bacterium UTPRO1]|nr:MAG: hypothetical protein B6D46_14270 [Polyangiaceae bacterium UTPRO1]